MTKSKKKIAFIGCGNMGQAMIGGLIKSGLFKSEQIIASDLDYETLKITADKYSIHTTTKNREAVKEADFLVLSIKPKIYPVVMKEIREYINNNLLIISIAAGKTIADIEKGLGRDKKIIRTMPNTPALIGEGMSAICPNSNVTEEELKETINIFESFGKAELLEESLINAAIAVSGSSPAYTFMFISSIAQGGIKAGLHSEKAYTMAAQAVLGAAKLVLKSGQHPEELKDMVCSPGGTTIEAVIEMEKKGLRSSVLSGIEKCITKAREIS